MRKIKFSHAESCRHITPEDGHYIPSQENMVMDGRLFFPTNLLMIGTSSAPDEHPGVLIMQGMAGAGIFTTLTPDGARELAAAILRAAEEADEAGAIDTAARLASLRADRGAA